ncbi:MAG: FUSC family membrane protein [Gillisia sp.]
MKSTDFSKALILGTAITLPITLGVYFDRFEFGLAIALGALLCSSSDVSGSQRHKNIGILISAALAVLVSLAGGYLVFNSWLFVPVLGVIMFGISYLAVFGFRASLISFSGLFAMVLSFANTYEFIEVYERALFIGFGGVWYMMLTMAWYALNPRSQTDQYIAQSLDLTGTYLETRGKLVTGGEERNELFKKLIDLQAELNEKHETLRDILMSARKNSGSSTYERKRLLIFIQLVDILELAMANPVNYEKMDKLMEHYQDPILRFQDLIFKMAGRLHFIAGNIRHGHKIPPLEDLQVSLEEVKKGISLYERELEQIPDEGSFILQNLYDYQEKQVEKITKIEQLLITKEQGELGIMKREEAARFLTAQEYDLKILTENFGFGSTIFKHSLRLAIVVMVGYAIGAYFSLQNAYWILLTIIVIMRPNYGLTKTRSKQRTVGTLIGAAIAVGIVFLTQNLVVYGFLSVISLIVAFSMVQKNYKTSAIFVTLSVVFIYALLEPNVLDVIQYRVLDTLIGAGLATLGNIILWPSWEFLGIKTTIADSISANRDYFKQVTEFYQKKGKVSTSYKVSRKQAFLGLGNLSSAFQRMTQEPRSKQKNLEKIYEVVVLNHSFLSSLASLGTYIQNHSTTPASSQVMIYSSIIDKNLERALAFIKNRDVVSPPDPTRQKEAERYFDQKFERVQSGVPGNNILERKTVSSLQEAQLVYEQLKWLQEISTKLEKKLQEINF